MYEVMLKSKLVMILIIVIKKNTNGLLQTLKENSMFIPTEKHAVPEN